jgi:hypothetical protein
MPHKDSHLLNAFDKYKDNQSKTAATVFFFFNIIKTKALSIAVFNKGSSEPCQHG